VSGGVREAPRHEIAGRLGEVAGVDLYGDLAGVVTALTKDRGGLSRLCSPNAHGRGRDD